MIVVETDVPNTLLPKDADHAICQGCFARTTIAAYCNDQWLLNPGVRLHTIPFIRCPARSSLIISPIAALGSLAGIRRTLFVPLSAGKTRAVSAWPGITC